MGHNYTKNRIIISIFAQMDTAKEPTSFKMTQIGGYMELNIIHNMDCVQGMREKIEEKSVDLIIADPPFAINFNSKTPTYNRQEKNVISDYREVSKTNYLDFSLNWLSECKRILKESGSMYIFSGWNHLKEILIALDDLKFDLQNIISWEYAFGVNCTKKYISSHYHVLYACLDNKKRKFNTNCRFQNSEKTETGQNARYIDTQDVWKINKENWAGCKKTATKLPGEIIKKILSYSSDVNDLVVDPFSGSGQTAWFSKEMNRNFVCFELSKEAYDFSMARLNTNQYLIKEKEND